MKQILQNLKTGETMVEEVPAPQAFSGGVQIRSHCTLVSAGTERMLLEFGKGNLLQKARQQPDKVKQVIDKVRTDGLGPTLDAVRNKLDTPLALGYCNVGTVIESGTNAFQAGDRVVSNGKHAEVVAVAKNLCAKIPDNVDDESAAFTVIGAIALQGIRLIQPTLGETVVVTGLGLIGLVAVQLLRAHGCRVIGIDFDPGRLALARQFGAETVNPDQLDPVTFAIQFSRHRGVDAVLITASTQSNEPIHQAASMCRKRGRIVLVGVVGMAMSRADFYEKELSFQVSCSYGPGRYDTNYEDQGNDYPVGFVRWTEQRNFEAVLDMLTDGRLDMKPLISHRFTLADAAAAYQEVAIGNTLGVLIRYPWQQADAVPEKLINLRPSTAAANQPVLGFIGAGNYAGSMLAPAFSKTAARLKTVASATGASAVHLGKKQGFEQATTDTRSLIEDGAIHGLVITTRHNTHAKWVMEALQNGKHVFVEKPLVINREELQALINLYESLAFKPLLMVGYNRRYSPLVEQMKLLVSQKAQAVSMIMTVNAGAVPEDHWTQDRAIGGGRILGEVCHFVDLLRHLADSPIRTVDSVTMDSPGRDSVSIHLKFANGSIGAIQYLANGSKAFAKERLELFCDGSILQLDNFRQLKGFGWPGFKSRRLGRQDKGQTKCTANFVSAIATGNSSLLIPFEELVEVADVCFQIDDQVNGVTNQV